MDTPPGSTQIDFSSADVIDRDYDHSKDSGLPAMLLYSDLPVHLSLLGKPASAGFESPFLYLSNLLGPRTVDYTDRSNLLNAARAAIFAPLRRAASLYQQGDIARLEDALKAEPLGNLVNGTDRQAIYRLARLTDMLFTTFADAMQRARALNEVLTHMNGLYTGQPIQYRQLLEYSRDELGFVELRRKVVQTSMEVLDHSDALLPGLAWAYMNEPRPDPKEFRVVRADFDELRARYVEIFELGSQSLALMGAIVNLSTRGRMDLWSDGKTRSPKAFLELKAFQREFVLKELPLTHEFYREVGRQTRNAFGHYAVEYDFATGELVDRKGSRASYLLFLADYLAAARLIWYVFGVIEKLSLDLLDMA